jgi:hypothetical protein
VNCGVRDGSSASGKCMELKVDAMQARASGGEEMRCMHAPGSKRHAYPKQPKTKEDNPDFRVAEGDIGLCRARQK